jgi:hypothetical protein
MQKHVPNLIVDFNSTKLCLNAHKKQNKFKIKLFLEIKILGCYSFKCNFVQFVVNISQIVDKVFWKQKCFKASNVSKSSEDTLRNNNPIKIFGAKK